MIIFITKVGGSAFNIADGIACFLNEYQGNVFSNTLGFIRQRKREFARYMSVGMTSAKIGKMFCIEALIIAGHPILITFPLTVLAMWYMLKMSYLEAGIFLAEAPSPESEM